MLTRPELSEDLARSSNALADARDWGEPSGKLPGRGPDSVAGSRVALPLLISLLGIANVNSCCAYGFRKPGGQSPVFCVGFQLVAAHPLEEFVQVHVLTTVDPLPLGVNLCVGLHRGDNCCRSDVHVPCFFDDLLKCSPDVPLPFGE